jgi:hypothetical protein
MGIQELNSCRSVQLVCNQFTTTATAAVMVENLDQPISIRTVENQGEQFLFQNTLSFLRRGRK